MGIFDDDLEKARKDRARETEQAAEAAKVVPGTALYEAAISKLMGEFAAVAEAEGFTRSEIQSWKFRSGWLVYLWFDESPDWGMTAREIMIFPDGSWVGVGHRELKNPFSGAVRRKYLGPDHMITHRLPEIPLVQYWLGQAVQAHVKNR